MSAELKRLLDELEGRIDKLKIAYEQYFMGREKLEPISDRQEVTRIVRQLQTTAFRNTAIKFRLNSLNQRFLTYQNYWNRILRQMEAGTYQRDIARMQRDLKRRGVDVDLTKVRSKGELEAAIMQEVKLLKEQESRGATEAPSPAQSEAAHAPGSPPPVPAAARAPGTPPPVPAVGKPPPPPAAAAAQTGANERMRRLYRAYVAAKKKVGEPTDGITYDRLVRTLQKQVPVIQKKTGCRHVDFKIEIKNGKAILKAVPRS